MFDPSLSFLSHINSLSKLAFFHLRQIVQLRPSAPQKLSFVLLFHPVPDYCNALFIGLPATSIARLQYIQNSAARILTRTKRSAHITPILADLHWLPVAYRIKVKLSCLFFKALNGLAPYYLCNLLLPYSPPCSLRPSDSCLLVVPRYSLSSMGGRSFSVVCP